MNTRTFPIISSEIRLTLGPSNKQIMGLPAGLRLLLLHIPARHGVGKIKSRSGSGGVSRNQNLIFQRRLPLGCPRGNIRFPVQVFAHQDLTVNSLLTLSGSLFTGNGPLFTGDYRFLLLGNR